MVKTSDINGSYLYNSWFKHAYKYAELFEVSSLMSQVFYIWKYKS